MVRNAAAAVLAVVRAVESGASEQTMGSTERGELLDDGFDFFLAQSKGKGHIKKMQAVLAAYMRAHSAAE